MDETDEQPGRPPGLHTRGRRLWDSTVAEFDLSPRGLALLGEACRTVDVLATLDKMRRTAGVVIDSPQGPRTAPWVVEHRQQSLALAKLCSALGLDLPDGP